MFGVSGVCSKHREGTTCLCLVCQVYVASAEKEERIMELEAEVEKMKEEVNQLKDRSAHLEHDNAQLRHNTEQLLKDLESVSTARSRPVSRENDGAMTVLSCQEY